MSINQMKRSFASSPIRGGRPALGEGGIWKQLTNFAHDTAGDVAMIFGLMAMAMFMLIGAAVDLGRWLNARDQTVSAMDAAVIAAGRALQTNGGNKSDALAMAKRYYDEAVKSRLGLKSDAIRFDVTESGTAIEAIGNAYISTPFLSLAGIPELPLLRESGAENSKAVMAVGGNAELNLEISMMLDVSGSMGSSNKLEDMKDAAKDLIDIVVWSDQSEYKSRVAVVPFSSAVIPPDETFYKAVTDPSWGKTKTVRSGYYNSTYKETTARCVGERESSETSDSLPGNGTWVKKVYTSNGNCGMDSDAKVLPMTNNKTTLKARIDELSANGNTAGHVGTAWAYYMLSPKWSSLFDSASQPSAYGTAHTEKIAILMTDGEYNYGTDSNGLFSSMSSGGNSSSNRAIDICSAMKDKGITVYTVGFALGSYSSARTTLKTCATDAAHFYDASDGEELKAAFRDIALKVSSLYLANTGR